MDVILRMKEKLLLLFLISTAILFAQQKTYTITWEAPKKMSTGSFSIEIPSFNTLHYQKHHHLHQLKFNLKNSKSRHKLYALIQLSPIIKDENGNFKKVTSFQINYNTSKNIVSNKAFTNSKVISNSVLSNGEWYKFYVDTTGVFKLSKSFLQRIGVNVNSIDPRNIRLFGNGGRMIPYSNSVPYPLDVQENAIQFIGEGDGVFDNEDYILFYI